MTESLRKFIRQRIQKAIKNNQEFNSDLDDFLEQEKQRCLLLQLSGDETWEDEKRRAIQSAKRKKLAVFYKSHRQMTLF